MLAINSADDLINPPELGILEREIKRVPHGRAIVIPFSDKTRGHGSHTIAALWKDELVKLLAEAPNGTEWVPPTELCSNDNNYCVKIIDASLPDKSSKGRIVTDYPESEDRTLALLSKGQVVAQYPTFAYLLNAFWSPDNTYVAVNNRRANAGDYLWILSLPDGGAIKVPEDLAPKQERKRMAIDDRKVMKEITRRFPNCTENSLRKGWLKARSWKSANELIVREEFRFLDPPSTVLVTVDEIYRVSADRFERLPLLDIRRVREFEN